MQRPITRGAAANSGLIFHVFVQDSTSTTGAGKASIGFASFTCYYIRSGEAISGAITTQDITTIGTYAAPTANTNIRIKAVDNTNMIGIYEIQLHLDWVNTTNTCQSLTIYLSASGAAVLPIQIPLRALDAQLLQATPTNITAGTIASVTNPVAITSNIKKNQALAAFEFLMTDSTNHNPATGKTVSVTRSIDGGAFGAGALSAVAEISSGMYSVDFAASDLNGKVITLRATATACDDTFVTLITDA
jgi:hypothetical protein